MGGGKFSHDPWEVSFKMDAKGQEIRDHHDPLDALFREPGDGACEIRLAKFEKSRFDVRKRTGSREFSRNRADTFIGGLDAGAVGEYDEAGGHKAAQTFELESFFSLAAIAGRPSHARSGDRLTRYLDRLRK